MTRGSALLEVLAIGFVATVLVLQALITVARIQVAGEEAGEAAQAAALHAARYGDVAGAQEAVARLAPGGDSSVHLGAAHAVAEVRIRVALVGPAGSPLSRVVQGEATVRLSPYRSEVPGG